MVQVHYSTILSKFALLNSPVGISSKQLKEVYDRNRRNKGNVSDSFKKDIREESGLLR